MLPMLLDPRLILYHKQSTSGRTRFLRFDHGLLAFAPLPPEATPYRPDTPTDVVRIHPAAPLRAAEAHLGLLPGALKAEGEFYAELDTPDGRLPILLAQFTTTDPPFAAAAALGGEFVAMTEARGLHPTELQLLREAYELILG